MQVELLYVDGCPSREELRPRVRALPARSGIDAQVQERRVETAVRAVPRLTAGS